MTEKNLKTRLRSGERLIGSLVTLPAPDVAEIMAHAGFDYLWIETEHAPMDFIHAQTLIQAVGGRCPCLIRIPDIQEVWIKKALDIGVDGIIAPQVRSAADAERIVEWSLYPPAGRRSVGVSRAHTYGMKFQKYVDTANDELVIVLQAENAEAVRNIGAIVETPGIDAVLIGPYDLSGSLGVLGQTTHPKVQEAITEIRRRCAEADMPVGIFTTDAPTAREYIEQGFTLIALGMDVFYLWQAARTTLEEVQKSR